MTSWYSKSLVAFGLALSLTGCGGGQSVTSGPDAWSTGGTGGEDAQASICFNPQLYQTGTRLSLRTQSVTPGDSVGSFDAAQVDIQVDGPRILGDVAASVSDGAGEVTIDSKTMRLTWREFLSVEEDLPVVLELGREREVVSANGSDLTSVVKTFTPARLFRFDLRTGESFSQRYSMETRRGLSGEVSGPSFTDVESLLRFEGVEQFRGPAGSVEACKFVEQRTEDGIDTVWTYWIGVGTGLVLEERKEQGGQTLRTNWLVEARLNGVGVLP
jgi:hypothetical protein